MIRVCLAMVLLAVGIARGHPTVATVAQLEVRPGAAGGVVEVIITHDTLAYALNDTSASVMDWQMYELLEGPPQALADALTDAHERIALGFRIVADGHELPVRVVRGPTLEDVERWKLENPTMRLPLTMEFVLRAEIPVGTADLSVRAPHVLDEVLLVVRLPAAETQYLPLAVAEFSPVIDVSAWSTLAPPTEPAAPEPESGHADAGDPWSFAVLGYRRIVPEGIDYQLIAFALVLLAPRLRELARPALAFAGAHAAAVALALGGGLVVPATPDGPIAGACVALVAIAAMLPADARGWRTAAAGVIGLASGLSLGADPAVAGVHGLAGIAAMIGGALAASATILAVAALTLGWFQRASWYRARLVVPLSAVIAAVGLWRVLGVL